MRRIRGALVVAEIALALVLTVAAGLLARSFLRLIAVDPGMRTAGVLTLQLTLPEARYSGGERSAQFYKTLLERVSALPGVRSAGANQFLPFRSNFLNSRMSVWRFQVAGQPPLRTSEQPTADFRVVTPGYFRTLSIALRQGRDFDDRDGAGAPRVAIINETLARKQMAGKDPLTQRLQLPPIYSGLQVVGVVADVKLYGLDRDIEPAIYVPHAQRPVTMMSLVVHSPQPPGPLAAAIRREVQALDPEQPIADVRTMEDVVSDSTVLRRISMGLLGAFSLLALALATVGIYGLTAYSVSQRTHEIGLRLALGARGADVLRQVVGQGALLALIGVALGTAGAFAVARLLKGMLFGIASTDPVVLAGVPAALLAIALLACYVPARRAARVDPMVALRYE